MWDLMNFFFFFHELNLSLNGNTKALLMPVEQTLHIEPQASPNVLWMWV